MDLGPQGTKAGPRRPPRVPGPFCASNPTAPVRHRRGAHGSCRHVSIGDDGGDGGVGTSRSARRGWRTSEWRESCTGGGGGGFLGGGDPRAPEGGDGSPPPPP